MRRILANHALLVAVLLIHLTSPAHPATVHGSEHTTPSPSTTSASPSTTSASPSTTSASPSTTSASPSTTSAWPSTTTASPSATGPASTPAPDSPTAAEPTADLTTTTDTDSGTHSEIATVVPALVEQDSPGRSADVDTATGTRHRPSADVTPGMPGRTVRLITGCGGKASAPSTRTGRYGPGPDRRTDPTATPSDRLRCGVPGERGRNADGRPLTTAPRPNASRSQVMRC
ncbi:hypothetical protein [Micromonospora sp. SH-82]|uniref:hypothetical protein n=1 Tax=Micromonospora sp. SH-82 TaxID=3132938 RepID=UPI003EC00221